MNSPQTETAPRIVKIKPHCKLAYLGIDPLTGESPAFTVEKSSQMSGAEQRYSGCPPFEPLLSYDFTEDQLDFLGQEVAV